MTARITKLTIERNNNTIGMGLRVMQNHRFAYLRIVRHERTVAAGPGL